MAQSILFLHGGNEFHSDSFDFDNFFVQAVSQQRIGIFPGASVNERDRIATVAFASGYFSMYGIELVEVVPNDFDQVDVLILPGGSPVKLLAELSVHREKLFALYERGAIYGASAGAMVLGRGFSLGSSWHAGLALGDFEALVHFSGTFPARPGALYGLPEAQGLAIAKSGEILAKSSGVQIRA